MVKTYIKYTMLIYIVNIYDHIISNNITFLYIVNIYGPNIKSNHFYCHITTAQVPW